MPNGSMEAQALRQQLRSQLGQGIRDTEQVLSQYRAAYPSFDLVDWPAVQSHLAGQPVPGVNVHPEVEAPRSPAWIQEQTIEPIAFGSMADPVSQAAFLLAPGMLRGGKALLETAGSPGPRLGGFIGERGNLGPVPRSQSGQPLPESAVRTEAGELQRLYHGTNRAYPDFAEAHYSSGAGGDLYGPGIYMTESPKIAQDYATLGWPAEAKEAFRQLETVQEMRAFHEAGSESARTLDDAMYHMEQAKVLAGMEQQAHARLQRQAADYPHWFREPANVRPVYADLKKPFDIEAPIDPAVLGAVRKEVAASAGHRPEWGELADPVQRFDTTLARQQEGGWSTNEALYQALYSTYGHDATAKAAANQALQRVGYDGITHMGGAVTGGQPHRVYIAFSPEQVYPSFNVEGAAR